MFGSSATGLSLPDSDLDLGIVVPLAPGAHAARGREQQLRLLQQVQRSLTAPGGPGDRQTDRQNEPGGACGPSGSATGIATGIELVRARVPVLKLRDGRSGLSVDLSISSGDGHANTQWLSCVLATLPEMRCPQRGRCAARPTSALRPPVAAHAATYRSRASLVRATTALGPVPLGYPVGWAAL